MWMTAMRQKQKPSTETLLSVLPMPLPPPPLLPQMLSREVLMPTSPKRKRKPTAMPDLEAKPRTGAWKRDGGQEKRRNRRRG